MTQSGKSFRSFVGLPPSTASTSDSVFVIIDAQNEYDYGLLKIANLEQSRPNILSILNKYRAAKGDIIHVIHESIPKAPLFTTGTELPEVFPELIPLSGERIVRKTKASAFNGTDLQEILDHIGKKRIVLAGYMAHNCVSATARVANEIGYDVLIAGDAVGDRDVPGASAEELVRVVLAELGDVVGTVIKSTDIQS